MKSAYASAIVLALTAVAAGQAFAGNSAPRYDETIALTAPADSTPGKTREQVRTELAVAQQNGDIVANLGGAKSDAKWNQLYSTNYQAQSVATTGKTREQVREELSEAQRTGDIVANLGGAKSDAKLNQVYSTLYSSARS